MNGLGVKQEKFKLQDGMECPFCTERLQHTGEYDSKTGKPILRCSKDTCYFNQVSFS